MKKVSLVLNGIVRELEVPEMIGEALETGLERVVLRIPPMSEEKPLVLSCMGTEPLEFVCYVKRKEN